MRKDRTKTTQHARVMGVVPRDGCSAPMGPNRFQAGMGMCAQVPAPLSGVRCGRGCVQMRQGLCSHVCSLLWERFSEGDVM